MVDNKSRLYLGWVDDKSRLFLEWVDDKSRLYLGWVDNKSRLYLGWLTMWIFLIQSGNPPDMKFVAQRISSRPNAL